MTGLRPLPSALVLFLLSISFRAASPRTLVVDGAAEAVLPVLRIGDSVTFKKVNGYELYMFRSRRASELCLLARGSLLNVGRGHSSSHFTWHPSNPGEYYFSYKNSNHRICEPRMCVQVTVASGSAQSPTPSPLVAPPPTPGNDARDFFPSLPHAHSSTITSPRPSPGASSHPVVPGDGRVPSSAAAPSAPLLGSGGGFPFISSNPALPLPTGEADSAATSRPFPVTGGGGHPVGRAGLGTQLAAWLSLAAGVALWGM